ncbi:TPA: Hcp family type VI secretion system effector [Salmonella enterica]|uniref:Hcp family type VI secretion system effector n=2 Tax=Salmonella diarizonae TaxID=59204 RepID=A0A726UJT1_SALDZ|nr:Hcp family type VI secretion system effector [Salmonella enterica]ECE6271620.1 Hcp family type VI secretion system effector [Salmonella enterica subsp. diarizonae]ECF6856691.1 Hcp family type VI secretion system effector [Salmonella enterica subsp. arizonae]EDW1843576.1 Hcp family type VI secretion system effector [Salmonella enterica subsp. enterica]EHN2142139.1 Hcp family type VI secretion system effector [Salmonella enterica subsp. diarizonae serovar 61:l,v:z35]EIG1170283.1 Hcp family ty
MAIPVYLWLKDDGGADIKGSVDVRDCEGSIEVNGFTHNLRLPTDVFTGKVTGTRQHAPLVFQKEIDSSSPYLMKAVATGQTLKSAEFKWYNINDAGQEAEYYNMLLENVKVVSVTPLMHDIKDPTKEKHNHLELVELRYDKITWKYCDGNLQFADSWAER